MATSQASNGTGMAHCAPALCNSSASERVDLRRAGRQPPAHNQLASAGRPCGWRTNVSDCVTVREANWPPGDWSQMSRAALVGRALSFIAASLFAFPVLAAARLERCKVNTLKLARTSRTKGRYGQSRTSFIAAEPSGVEESRGKYQKGAG